jgi:NADPH-dependent curcumin reductase CurA
MKIKKINKEINELKEELEDQILLQQYYFGTDPEYKKQLEKSIKMKDRLRKIINLLKE